jgi:hypothetical protein
MASVDEMTAGARTYLRDYPLYFEVDEGPLNTLTIRLPHPLVAGNSLQVYVSDPTAVPPVPAVITKDWQLDERNGLLKLSDVDLLGKNVVISGYHFSWFADSDLQFHLQQILSEFTYSGTLTLETLEPVHIEVIEMGAVVHALWSLALELSLDIDVSTPEGMFIPARQRFTQVIQMLQYWEAQYQNKAAMLNIGLGALEMFRLRRVAYMTGRYVPVYREREFDDPRPPERLYPPIPSGVPGGSSEIEEFTLP